MTFLTILGVTEILCSFRLVLEGKTGNEIPESSRLEFLEVFSNTSRPLNRGGISDLSFLGILLAICQKSWRAKFLGSDRLFCFISIWLFLWLLLDSFVLLAASRTLLQQLLASLNFTLNSEDLLYWYKQKSELAAAQAAKNHGDEWGLTWYLQWGIYTSIPT